MDRLQLLTLLASFFGAAVIVVAAYAVFCLVASISEGKSSSYEGKDICVTMCLTHCIARPKPEMTSARRSGNRRLQRPDAHNFALPGRRRNQQRNIISLRDITTGDLEQGDTHSRTKQSIAKLMSDAERQYVAEYAQKAPPATSNGQHYMFASGGSAEPGEHIKVHQLNDGPGNSVGTPFHPLRSCVLFADMRHRNAQQQTYRTALRGLNLHLHVIKLTGVCSFLDDKI